MEHWQFQQAVLVENFVVGHVVLDEHQGELFQIVEEVHLVEAVDAFLVEVEIAEVPLAFLVEVEIVEVLLVVENVEVAHPVEAFEIADL